MADTTRPEPAVTFSPEELCGITNAAAGLVSAREASDAALIDALGSDFRVTIPFAGKTSARIETTAEQQDGVTVRGRLTALTPESAFVQFALTTRTPYRLRVKGKDADKFIAGGRVVGDLLDRPLFIIAPPRPLIVGGTVVTADVLLDVERPG